MLLYRSFVAISIGRIQRFGPPQALVPGQRQAFCRSGEDFETRVDGFRPPKKCIQMSLTVLAEMAGLISILQDVQKTGVHGRVDKQDGINPINLGEFEGQPVFPTTKVAPLIAANVQELYHLEPSTLLPDQSEALAIIKIDILLGTGLYVGGEKFFIPYEIDPPGKQLTEVGCVLIWVKNPVILGDWKW